ncbi:insulinase family protein [bacterium]|nr:insulinase family protein [bacterium]
MRTKGLSFLCLILALVVSATAQEQEFKFIQELGGIKEYQLNKNGLKVLLMEDHSAPVLTFMVTFNVGSRNEVIGTTGATHILEHLMFKGTPNFNREKGNSLDMSFGRFGAINNASTWNDYTNYYEILPSEHLEMVVEIEADRMRNLSLLEKDKASEMTVVRNEFERGENDPLEALDKNIWATAYQAHPYHHSAIGWRSDIENISIPKLKEFYDTFYWPDNATVTIIGDFDQKKALSLIYKYFGVIPRSPKPIPQMTTEEPVQEGPRRVILRRSGPNGIVGVAHKIPKAISKERYAVAVLATVLGTGKNSRFYKSLIDQGLASNVYIQNLPFRDEGLHISYAYLTPGVAHESVEKIIHDEYQKIIDQGITKAECDAAIAQLKASETYARDGSFSIAGRINTAIAAGDWKWFVTYVDELSKVTPEDVKAVAQKYLKDDQMTVGYFIPKEGATTGSLDQHSVGNYARHYRAENENELIETSSVIEATGMAANITDKKVAGIRVLSMKTGAKNIVTMKGCLMAGGYFNPSGNKAIADLTAAMLDQGTTKRDKFAIAAQLEKIGARITFSSGNETLNFSVSCLSADVPTVINILAEQLRYPLFDASSFEIVKKRRMALYQEEMDDTDVRAEEKLMETIFPASHSNHGILSEQMVKDIGKTTLTEISDFYKKHYGPASMILVAVGDVRADELQKSIQTNFNGWSGGVNYTIPKRAVQSKSSKPIVVTLKDKTSASLSMGLPTGILQNEKDYVALYVATNILGNDFQDRLMATVRDKEGLTYGVYSFLGGHTYSDGYWEVVATFSPDLLKKGMESTRRQVDKWIDEGVTEDELKDKKTNISGTFKVSLSTTAGMANSILALARRNVPMVWLDEYPQKVNVLTLKEVNDAIKKYVVKENIYTVVAGSVDEKLEKLSE